VTESALGDPLNDKLNDEANFERISKNLCKMSKKEKFDFLGQESPELFELVRDYKAKLAELELVLIPVFSAVKAGHMPQSLATDYIVNKTKLYLIFCSHLSFYFILKSQRCPVDNHPIIKNILQFRNLCKQINSIDEKLKVELDFIGEILKSGRQVMFKRSSHENFSSTKAANKVKKSVKFRDSANKRTSRDQVHFEGDNDESDDDEDNMVVENDESSPAQPLNAAKRAIGYQIEKNKGLTPKRDKTYRNPRVRNRMKARKATIKRKSIVPKTRDQEKRYTGESTGIRTGIVRSRKII
jgi:U3 small nucleolar RNA-associated protein 3